MVRIKKKTLKYSLSQKGVDLIASFEGFSSKPYRDSGGVWTIGFGTTYINNVKVSHGTPSVSRDQALGLLKINVRGTEKMMRKMITGVLTQSKWDALVSLTYNIGIGNFQKSSVLKYINAGDIKKAAESFILWNKDSTGKVLTGLVLRRKTEKALFLN